MKQRIRKLVNEAGLVAYGEDSGEYCIPVPVFDARIDRLADLIIEECFNIVNNFAVHQASKPDNILGENLHISMKITESAWKIKEHFEID
jgi:hypothetical protein